MLAWFLIALPVPVFQYIFVVKMVPVGFSFYFFFFFFMCVLQCKRTFLVSITIFLDRYCVWCETLGVCRGLGDYKQACCHCHSWFYIEGMEIRETTQMNCIGPKLIMGNDLKFIGDWPLLLAVETLLFQLVLSFNEVTALNLCPHLIAEGELW